MRNGPPTRSSTLKDQRELESCATGSTKAVSPRGRGTLVYLRVLENEDTSFGRLCPSDSYRTRRFPLLVPLYGPTPRTS